MKKSNVLLISIFIGLLLWFIESVLDFFLFYEMDFLSLLILDVPQHEIYVRITILVCFTIFGFINLKIISRLKKTESQLELKTHHLDERVKELDCFYRVSRLLGDSNVSLEKVIHDLVHLIPNAWQYPEITCAQILLDGKNYQTDGFYETDWILAADILVFEKKVGIIRVCYLKAKPVLNKSPFLTEEHNLLEVIATELGTFIERKQAEFNLRKSEEKYRVLVDNSLQGFIIVTGEIPRFRFVNNRIAEMTGYSCKELENFSPEQIQNLIHPEDREEFFKTYPEQLSGKIAHVHEVTRGVNRDGNIIWLENVATRIEFQGEPAIQLAMTDITDRKRAEKELLLEESRLETLLKLSQMNNTSLQELSDFALEEGVRLTESEIGYLAFVNSDETILTIHSWSQTAMKQCHITNKQKEFRVESTGLWGEVIRQRKPIIINDYNAPDSPKKGYPEGHVIVERYMSIPVFDGNSVVAVAGVGNKKESYNSSDVRQLTLLMDGMWKSIQRRQAEEKIQQSLVEKEVMLKEIHHRVKNNLQIISSLLNLQSYHISDKQFIDAFNDSKNRVKSMALVHERMYETKDFTKINFGDYINSLARDLFETYNITNDISLDVNVDHVSFNIDTAIPCGLILNELISNSLKYAFPDGRKGNIQINIHSNGDNCTELFFSDDGIGIPHKINVKEADTLGLKLIHILIDQLDGSSELIRSNGTCFKIKFRNQI